MTTLVFPLLLIGLADPPKSPPVEELAKERSPRAMVQALTAAIMRGDVKTFRAGFDLSTQKGRATADAMQTLPRFIGGCRRLVEAVEKKYGKPGLEAVDKTLKVPLVGIDEKLVRQSVEKVKVYIAEDGQTALVGDIKVSVGSAIIWGDGKTQLERKDGRWFIAPAEELEAVEQTAALYEALIVSRCKRATELVRESKSLAELQQALEALEKGLTPKPIKTSK